MVKYEHLILNRIEIQIFLQLANPYLKSVLNFYPHYEF